VHPLYGRSSRLVLADYVTMDTGTGCVHTAPGHGLEDYTTALRYGLDVLSPVDDQGHFTPEAGPDLAGLVCDRANARVVELLDGALLNEGKIEHSYPHCWRCDNPVIYRSTYQWFLDIDKVRDAALDEIGKARWIPSWGQARIAGMVESRPDWCISRQRVWGVPIPAFFCDDCGEVLVDRQVIDHVADLIAADEKGADVWWRLEAADLVPPGVTCKCGSSSFRKETDIMSVWFDSGCSHYCVLRPDPELAFPADLYLEGDDQYQCWFQTSLWVAVALGEAAPFKMVVGHGFFVDETGQKLSKSKGNIIDPADIYSQYGADVLRMWFTYADFRSKMFLTESILQQVADAYRRLRNTARFMLANLQDFDPAKDALPYEELSDLDKWALMRMQQVIERMTRAFDAWDLHLFHHELHAFVATDLSAFYLDVLKDTLYTELPGSQLRRSAQTALWHLLVDLVRMMAPIMTFTSDEIWEYLRRLAPSLPVSVQLDDWPRQRPEWIDPGLQERFAAMLRVRERAMEALEHAKAEGVLSKPLEAHLDIRVDPQLAEVLEGFGLGELKRLFIVSEVALLGLEDPSEQAGAEVVAVRASLSEGEKCRRCWVRDTSVGESSDYPDLCDRCLDRVTRWPS
jgi:isoleucyl-tRNA synthetase